MAHYLVYWRTFFKYGVDNARTHVCGEGYGSSQLNDIGVGDTLWVVVKSDQDEWKLAQRIAVSDLVLDNSENPPLPRAIADSGSSSFLPIDHQLYFEATLRRLQFLPKRPIEAKGSAIGMHLQQLRRLALEDVEVLISFSRVFSDIQAEYPASEIADVDPEASRRRILQLNQIVRNPLHVKQIKEVYKDTCQLCNETIQINGGRMYSEVHHIQPLGGDQPGPDIPENMLCVCPNCHVRLDFGAIRLDLTSLIVDPSHKVSNKFINYHNNVRCTSP
jgi:hypothetical protein